MKACNCGASTGVGGVKKFKCQLCEIFGEICKALRISDENNDLNLG